ncbi:MAG TPA: hypothetical protein VGP46_07035, partial [Acidimicrobiales bacterium]|nr:hypothetical protein [Acidimicrobiales bacterium]
MEADRLDDGFFSAVAARFGLGSVTQRAEFVVGGAMGEIWRIGAGGARWAVKVLFEWAEVAEVPGDLAFQDLAWAAGVPLPRPRRDAAGVAVASVAGRRVRVYEWVDLLEHETVVLPVTAAAAGRLLGRLHALDIACDEAIDPWYTTVPNAAAWVRLTESAQRAGARWGRDLEDRIDSLIRLPEGAVAVSTRRSLVCHRDFDVSNVLPARDGGGLV